MHPFGGAYRAGAPRAAQIGGVRPEGIGLAASRGLDGGDDPGSAPFAVDRPGAGEDRRVDRGPAAGRALEPLPLPVDSRERDSQRCRGRRPKQTATTTAVVLRLRTLCRIGFSTSAYETHERRKRPTIRPSFTATESSWPA